MCYIYTYIYIYIIFFYILGELPGGSKGPCIGHLNNIGLYMAADAQTLTLYIKISPRWIETDLLNIAKARRVELRGLR